MGLESNGEERSQQAVPDKTGRPTFSWDTTLTSVFDTVKLIVPPSQTLPIVFVPGIMGSNLCSENGKPVWLLNSTAGAPIGLAWEWARKGDGARQTVLHPDRTRVFSGGAVPSKPVGTIQKLSEFTSRGWGEVGEASYHKFLTWLEGKLNSEGFNPAKWPDFSCGTASALPTATVKPNDSGGVTEPRLQPGISMTMLGLPTLAEGQSVPEPIKSDELLKRAKFRFPVYACGYNWLASNDDGADRLAAAISKIIAENNKGGFKCCQVILVTHSMGGLVARACALLPGMHEKIAGIVHGVMPTVGAAVAYRRCKVGMLDEDVAAALVIGTDGPAVTAVFAQAPGALQLLPSRDYGLRWLQINDHRGTAVEKLPINDPYTEFYLRKDRWWGLVNEAWLRPSGGTPIPWEKFAVNIKLAKSFHERLSSKYHTNSFVYYGAGDGKQASFDNVVWDIRPGLRPIKGTAPTIAQTVNFSHVEVRTDGSNKIQIEGEQKYDAAVDLIRETSFWEIKCGKQDGRGDGTVPARSGQFPKSSDGTRIRQQFRLTGFSHEPAFKDIVAQSVTHYAITKIAATAKIS